MLGERRKPGIEPTAHGDFMQKSCMIMRNKRVGFCRFRAEERRKNHGELFYNSKHLIKGVVAMLYTNGIRLFTISKDPLHLGRGSLFDTNYRGNQETF